MKALRKKKAETSSTQRLADVYYNPTEPAGYAGAAKLKAKFPRDDVGKWLASQSTYTLHKPMRRRFPVRKYRVSHINELWQMDLMEMIPYASINKGYKYILTCVDVFSRFARAQPLKSKNASAVHDAIEIMLKDDKSIPRYIQTDEGKEFYNNKVGQLLERHKIQHYSVYSQFKAALVERFNRTLREKLNRYFTHNRKKVWIDVLPDIIKAYNKTPHRSLKGESPATMTNNLNFWLEQEKIRVKIAKLRKPYKIGSYVRISRISPSPFRKNFDQNWSEEIFEIVEVDTKDKPIMYTIKDVNEKIIRGKFYHEELQVIAKDDIPPIYRIEHVIRTRGTGKHKQYLIKWYGYDKSHNSWISGDNFVDKV
jgi:L-rhamnose mutarotase